MKRKIILFCFAVTISFALKAQFVTIPDSHFVHWLNAHVPAAMSGNQMDTSNVSVTSMTDINIAFDTLCNLEGIQYFHSLRTLNCSNNHLDTLLNLPDSLQTLICSGNQLIYLMEIPDSVTFFDCGENQLDSLPILPINLSHFDCHNNRLMNLPFLPTTINFFDCSGNQLTSLPALPPFLPNLNCAENQLSSLPVLPESITIINCENNLLTSLPGLPDSLVTLNCGANSLTTLPALPVTLTDLECYANQLPSLPSLPGSLITLVCGENLLTALPALPATLITLKCYNNQLTALPILPGFLDYLDCSSNFITGLPSLSGALTYLDCKLNQLPVLPFLPGLLQTLNCSANLLTNIPALPSSIEYLSCSNNSLLNLPALPGSLQYLECNHATLDSLPVLPATLFSLDCSYNSLVSLPSFSGSLTELYCNNNLLTDLPILPSGLTYLICANNTINCFREFSNEISWLDISNNSFTCLPNYIPVMDAVTLNYPLCVSGDLTVNPNGCSGARGIVGFTYTDLNANCMKDSLDGNLMNLPLQIFDSSGTFIGQTYTALNGIYDFPKPPGTYKIQVDTVGMPISPQCTTSGADSTISLTAADPLVTNVNFDFNCKPGFDVGVRSVSHCGLVFPGETHQLRVDAGDMSQWYNMACASGLSGQVKISISGPVIFSGIMSGALMPTIAGSTYTYSIADFGTINNREAFGLILTVNPTAASGNQVCINITVSPAGGDNDTTNNSFSFCYGVVNSHDPNMKETYPEEVPLNYDGWITYTVHFQNTGNAPAINIDLKDTLDNQLDVSTFEAIGYSHTNHVVQNGNILLIRFPNINLSDSSSNTDHSKGFFQYRIKPLPGLGCGSVIHNKASLYFDYNAPIVTNTTINSYPQIPVPQILNDTTVCYSSSLSLNINSEGNSINWYDAASTLIHTGNTFSLDNITTSTILYSQIVAPGGCSTGLESITISVLPHETSPLLSLNDTICDTASLSLSASAIDGWNYHWSGPAGFISSIESPVITPLSESNSGIYSLYISNGQCLSDTAAVLIHIDSPPIIIVTNNPYICLGDSVNLEATGNLNSIVWGTSETGEMIIVAPSQTTLYSVSGANTCGLVTQNIFVTVNMPPTATAEDAILISGESTPLNASGGILYSWYPTNGLSCGDCANPVVTITSDQLYSVIVTDANGCSDTTSVSVKVAEDSNTIYIPNAFSPNGDGLNDEFMVSGRHIEKVEMIICNRLGDKIFETNEKEKGWDGMYKGIILYEEVFVYKMKVTMEDGTERKYNGTVTTVR